MLADHAALGTPPRPRRRAPAERLRAAVLALAGGLAEVASHSERNWASITFAGSRHQIELHFVGDDGCGAGEQFIDALPEHEFAIPGHLVADATIVEVDHRIGPEPLMKVRIEVLLLDEG